MIVSQINGIAALPGDRQLEAIDERLKQDAWGVQYAGPFSANGAVGPR
jgi:hypothetical protein